MGIHYDCLAVTNPSSRHRPNRERLLPLVDVSVRAISIGARAAFMIVLARWLPVEDYASLVLTMALTGYLIYVAGLDFYASAHRELLAQRESLDQVVKAQAVMLGAGFALSVLLLCVLPIAGGTLMHVAVVAGLLLGEAVCAELSRLLIVIGRPSVANFVNFLKAAGWMLPVLAIGPWQAGASMLPMIYAAWALGLLLAVALGIWALGLRLQDVLGSSRTRDLIRLHVRLMPILFGGTVAMRAAFSLDRVFMEWAAGAQSLAPYALFAGMGAAFMALVETGAVARLYRPLVMAVAQRDLGEVRQLERSMLSRTLVLIALMFVTLWLGLDFLLVFIDRPEFSSQSYFAWILGGAYACYALSLPFHVVLYALARDRLLTGIQVTAAALLCLFGALAAMLEQGAWVSCGVLVSFLYSTAHKALAARTALADLRRGTDGS